MASSLANQLSQIAANSTNSLNLKAQKAAHSKSLIFEPRIAASQSFDTIYTLCHEGFQELCLLDGRFLEFQRTIFSEQSQDEDRTIMTAEQNSELDRHLEAFLGLVGGRLRLNPAIKAIEWLVRRFRIHEYNTSFVLTTFLPYHTLPIFVNLMSILPTDIPEHYRFLHPYIRSLTQPTRHAIVQAATVSAPFTAVLNGYVLRISKVRQHYNALVAFWAGVMTEATSGMLDKSRSGRKGVQQQNEQDNILRLLPTLNEGLAMKKVPDLRIGCYMLLSVMASKGGLDDKLLTAMMEAVVLGWTTETIRPGLVCLSVLAQHRTAKQFTKRLTQELLNVQDLPSLLIDLAKERQVDKLSSGLCLALVDRLSKSGDGACLSIVGQVVGSNLLSNAQTTVLVKSLLLVAHQLEKNVGHHRDLRSPLASSLVQLTQLLGHVGYIVRGVLKDTEIDMDELEMKLNTAIRMKELQSSSPEEGDVEMGDAHSSSSVSFSNLLQQLPSRTANETSFLSHDSSHIYPDLCQAFIASTASAQDVNLFDKIPILRRNSTPEDILYLTFYMRLWCGPSPAMARVSALRMVIRRLSESKDTNVDVQALIPYAIAALGDISAKVRRAAADLLIEMDQHYPANIESKKSARQFKMWGFDGIYGNDNHTHTQGIKWLSLDIIARILREILIPALEECVLDSKHVDSLFQRSLNTPHSAESQKKNEIKRLPQAARASILSFLASHIIHTPLFSVKLRLLTALNQVRSIGGSTRTKVLLPVLQQWASVSRLEASKHHQDEKVQPSEFDSQSVLTVTANDEDGIRFLTSIIKGETAVDRPELIEAVFRRIQDMWSSLKGSIRLQTAQTLMDASQSSSSEASYPELVSAASAELLRTVPLSTDVLLSFLAQLPTASKLADKPPVTKRRRTSHGEVARAPVQDARQVSAAMRKVTFVLQLIDSSSPGPHPELTKDLFNTLAELQHFKAQVASELAYLQNLVLGSLLAILKAQKLDPKLKFDRAAVRVDLLVDCVQKTASPQVQNAALLLIACLADAAPELVLHSVMPIFTFMGSSVLRQNDAYSAHVINQTIREVIPPLIASLRKEKGDPVTGAAELLLSFVAAYEHVPPHRRCDLLISLVQTLGAEDFLYALLAMLVDKYGMTESIKSFATELSNSFTVEIQLNTVVRYLDLVGDILKPKPTYSTVLLSAFEDGQDHYQLALNELMLLPHLLSQERLVSQTGKLLERDDMDAARVRDLYSALLENVLALADILKDHKRLHGACGDVLESLLGLLVTSDFIKSVEGLLDRPDESLRRKILRSLEVRIDRESRSDTISRLAMLAFLPQLTAIIRDSKDVQYKQIAVDCVDKIAEKYGKKDLEAVAAAAETIASNHCLGQPDDRLRIAALLCLASLVEILREGIVSVLPVAIPKALEYVKESLNDSAEGQKLHDAGYSFISALVHHLPYMISGGYLDKLLMISIASAEAGLDDEADESRTQCLHFAAKQIDAKPLFAALEKTWDEAALAGALALREYIEVLSIAIDKHSKNIVTKNSSVLANIFKKAFDLRRQWASASDDRFSHDSIAEVETEVNDVAIKMIYKFNDSTFRPIFANLVEWALSLPKKDAAGRILRLQSIYGFMEVFFGNLKSVVTSYAAYFLDNAVDTLKSVNIKDEESMELWSRVLRTLAKCFEHDQDDFWQSPSHFSVIAPVLCGQFAHANDLALLHELVPAVVGLAAAADSSGHQKELNGAILKHMRSEAASVRLAAVKCEQALTDRLGDEWLSMLPEMLPFISELQEDDDDVVEKETHRWIVKIEDVLGESLDNMLQ